MIAKLFPLSLQLNRCNLFSLILNLTQHVNFGKYVYHCHFAQLERNHVLNCHKVQAGALIVTSMTVLSIILESHMHLRAAQY